MKKKLFIFILLVFNLAINSFSQKIIDFNVTEGDTYTSGRVIGLLKKDNEIHVGENLVGSEIYSWITVPASSINFKGDIDISVMGIILQAYECTKDTDVEMGVFEKNELDVFNASRQVCFDFFKDVRGLTCVKKITPSTNLATFKLTDEMEKQVSTILSKDEWVGFYFRRKYPESGGKVKFKGYNYYNTIYDSYYTIAMEYGYSFKDELEPNDTRTSAYNLGAYNYDSSDAISSNILCIENSEIKGYTDSDKFKFTYENSEYLITVSANDYGPYILNFSITNGVLTIETKEGEDNYDVDTKLQLNGGSTNVLATDDNGGWADFSKLIYDFKEEQGSAPLKAKDPNPFDGNDNQSITVDLNWSDGGGATSYDVYFGTDSTPDDSSYGSEFKGNQSSANFDPGTLEYNTTYYWRIDSKNSDGTTTGDVWSFTTEKESGTAPIEAKDPSPADEETNQSITVNLSWSDGGGATSYDVYFGTDSTPDDSSYGSEFKGNQSPVTFDPGTLEYNTTYYWRIDSKNSDGTTTGEVWSFTTEKESETTPIEAKDPSPADEETNQSITVNLSWSDGGYTTSYDVYFGTDSTPDDSSYGSEFKGNQSSANFDPGTLEYNTTYYWRIDSKNSDGTTTGEVWSFTTEKSEISFISPTENQTVSLPVELKWEYTGNVGSNTQYSVTIKKGSEVVYFKSLSLNETVSLSNSDKFVDGDYEWIIRVTDNTNHKDYTSFFTINGGDGCIPGEFTNCTPNSSSDNISLSPTLSWNYSEHNGEQEYIIYQVFEETGSAREVGRTQNQSIPINETTFWQLRYNKTYEWRVCVSDCNDFRCSEKLTFTTREEPGNDEFSNIFPEDGAENISTKTSTSWSYSNHDNNTIYKVFYVFENGAKALYQESNSQTFDISKIFEGDELAPNITYRWEVEVYKDDKFITSSGILSFTTGEKQPDYPKTAINPTPQNNEKNIPGGESISLSWELNTDGAEPDKYIILYWDEYAKDVSDINQYETTDKSINTIYLKSNTKYSWQVVSYFEESYMRSETWNFSTGIAKATNPNPSNEETNQPITVALSWDGDSDATSYYVYFGANPTPDNSEYKGNQISTSFDPGTLEYNTTYYWRIDTKNSDGTTTGDVWSFTTEKNDTGIEDLKEKGISITPNPAKDKLKIVSNKFYGNIQVEIYNLGGVCIYSKQIRSPFTENLNVSNFNSGTHILKMKIGNEVATSKILIIH